jgi:hypothetical protein
LNSATIWGIAVIFTRRAEANPITVPIAIPAAISQYVSMSSSKSVKKIAIAIPTAAMTLPDLAVAGDERRLMPRMSRSAATTYARLMTFCESASGVTGPGRPVPPACA